MNIYLTSVDEILRDKTVRELIFDNLQIALPATNLHVHFEEELLALLNTLRGELQVVVETDYADPVYRDSYYHLYSTKFRPYTKNCVRLSFFEPVFLDIQSFIEKSSANLQDAYLGFVILRPIMQCMGRNAIAPSAKKGNLSNIEICKAKVKATCVGHKLCVAAFPHASQDGEHMSCAETSVWSLLEYFGNKYAIYDPILPSQIINSLKDSAVERIIPTVGLTYTQIATLLKKKGFETKIYHHDNNPKFKELFTCYIESGLPLITVIQATGFGHAVVCVGREQVDPNQFQSYKPNTIKDQSFNRCSWNECITKFVVNDDNFPSYRKIDFKNPAEGYPLNQKDDSITSFIVPLHEEILVPAEIAFAIRDTLLDNHEVGDCIEKTFLTTSRSFREYIVNNPDLSSINKQYLLQKSLPKFVWVTEIYTPNSLANHKVIGTFVVDATGNTRNGDMWSALIFSIWHQHIEDLNITSKEYEILDSNFPPSYQMFKGNLKK